MNNIKLNEAANVSSLSRDSKGKKWEDYDTIVCLDGTVINMQKLIFEQAKAKAALIHLENMFATFANKLEPVYTFHIETQATDGVHLLINPQFTNSLTFEEKVFLMAHECMHCVLDHMRRGKQANHDPEQSNIAADYEVNQTLVDIGLFQDATIKKLHGLIDSKYSGWSYEHIYDDKPKMPNMPKQSQGGQGGQGQQGSNQGNSGNGGDNSNGQNQQNQNGQGSQNQGGQGQSQQDGRGEGNQGVVRPEDCAPLGSGNQTCPMPGGFVDPKEGNNIADAEGYATGPTSADAISSDWKNAATKEAQKHQGRGTVKGLCEKILGIWLTGTDWKKKFRKIIGRSLNTQDRRQAFANKNKLASFNSISRTDKDKYDCVDYITIFADVSGSISDEELRYMLSEVYQIAWQFKPEVLVLCQFADQIVDKQVFKSFDEYKRYSKIATKKGSGGTDIKCGWDLMRTDKIFKHSSSELVIIITDGYLEQYKRDTKKMNNLCWAVVDNTSFQLKYPDARTSVVYLTHKDLKK